MIDICTFYTSLKKPSKKTKTTQLRHDTKFPTMWYVRPAKPQTSLRIRTVWSEPLPVT